MRHVESIYPHLTSKYAVKICISRGTEVAYRAKTHFFLQKHILAPERYTAEFLHTESAQTCICLGTSLINIQE